MLYHQLIVEVEKIIKHSTLTKDEKLKNICILLFDNFKNYTWVGFYFANPATKTLHLGSYIGAVTEHTVIPFGKGICGQVAVSNQNFVVSDVTAQDNYIACSTTVKSEIVVPIFVNNKNIGQIDIDSNVIDAFSEKDERFLEEICRNIATLY